MSTPDPVQSAKAAGLRYVADARPGIRRERDGDGFRYVKPSGQPVTDETELQRIKALGIPPAYEDVWICPIPNGHLQATGRDAKGRKQYRYHAKWRATRDETKYDRMIAFGDALPLIRARVERDLSRPGLPREKVLATVVRLLENTLIRVGNEQYAKTNHHYGLTTMHNRHVEVYGGEMEFHFRGKSGKVHTISLHDRRLAHIVQKCRELPGYELFEYQDANGDIKAVGSDDVNAYLHEIVGSDYTAKDFRTWAGTVLSALSLQEFEVFATDAQAKKNIVSAIKSVSERLGNTPAICRRCYVHPAILESYLDGTMLEILQTRAAEDSDDGHTLRPEEAAVLALLQRRLAAQVA